MLFTGLVASPALLVALGMLGGTEATSVRDCSHLVTDGIRRTLKFLCALGRGIPIVTPQWLLQVTAGTARGVGDTGGRLRDIEGIGAIEGSQGSWGQWGHQEFGTVRGIEVLGTFGILGTLGTSGGWGHYRD